MDQTAAGLDGAAGGHGLMAAMGLLRQHDFRALWLGAALSQFAARMITFGLPLVAITQAHATAWQVGLVSVVSTVAFAMVGLPAGAIVDRVRQRRLLLWSDFARALLVAALAAPLLGGAALGPVYVVAFGTGVLAVFFDVAHQSYLPKLIGRDDLVAGNGQFTTVAMIAQVVGPVCAGAAIAVAGLHGALLVIAVAFLGSALCLTRITAPDQRLAPAADRHLGREIATGLRFVLRHRMLRRIALAGAMYNLFALVIQSIVTVRLVRDLGLSAEGAAVYFTAGGAGGVAGALAASWLADRIGRHRIIGLSLLVTAPFALLTPLVNAGGQVWLAATGYAVVSVGAVVFNVAQVSARQELCPDELLGRMNATLRFLLWGSMPLGALLGSACAATIGVRGALWVGAAGMVVACVPVCLPGQRWADEPVPVPDPAV
jgi:MFS family permease